MAAPSATKQVYDQALQQLLGSQAGARNDLSGFTKDLLGVLGAAQGCVSPQRTARPCEIGARRRRRCIQRA